MIEVVVTQGDLKSGKKGSMGFCPVSYALKRVFKKTNIFILCDYAQVDEFVIELPPHVTKFIQDFDKGALVRTITFQIPNPFDNQGRAAA